MCLVIANAYYVNVVWRGGELASRPGPVIEAQGMQWKTRLIEDDPDHRTYAIWLHAEAPDVFLAKGDDLPVDTLLAICNAVVSDRETFMPETADYDALEHIDLNLLVNDQKLFIHDISIYVRNGECSQTLAFDYVASRVGKFSKHELETENMSVLEAWGLRPGQISFASGTEGKRIEMEFELLDEFDRDPTKINVAALCVFTLLSLNEQHSVLGLTVDPSKYTQMKISLQSTRSFVLFHYTSGYGSAEMEIADGKCVGVEESQTGEDA